MPVTKTRLLVALATGLAGVASKTAPARRLQAIPGGRDCPDDGGYVYCPQTGECVRPWEDGCPDPNSCLASAGYTWCPQKNKCVQVWNEPCEGPDDCVKDGGYEWCEETDRCVQPWNEPPGSPCAQEPEEDDDHGCCVSCGESYCEAKDKCIQSWMEPCDDDDHGCLEAAGYVWCEVFGECVRPFERPCTNCKDSKSWRKHNNNNIGCDEVADDPGKLCGKHDQDDVKASDACPIACGTCDSHGCVVEAGYFWCPQIDRCVQPPLPPGSPCRQPPRPPGARGRSLPGEDQPPPLGAPSDDEYGCLHSAGYSWCASANGGEGDCVRLWETPCEDPYCADDSASWTKTGATSKDCAWVADKPDTRCAVKGEDKVTAAYACPMACSSKACDDSTTWHKKSDATKACGWVSNYPQRRCFVNGEDGTAGLEGCPFACRKRSVKSLT